MTTNIEQKFFECFDIKPECDLPCQKRGVECINNTYCGNKYPQITSDILLELICVCNTTHINGFTNYFVSTGQTIEKLKEEILEKCIKCQSDIKAQVQSLFTEVGE